MVCRQLGYNGTVIATTDAEFGQGNGTIWMDGVICAGSETSLNQCPFNGWGIHDCVHGKDAGVVCQGRELYVCVCESCVWSGTVSCCGVCVVDMAQLSKITLLKTRKGK